MMTETVVNIDNRNPSTGQPKMTATVTTTSSPPNQQSADLNWLKFNIDYFRTLPGIIKLAELIIGILCMALASPAFISSTHFFLFVVVTSFISTLLWAAAYLLGIREVLTLPVNWILTEFINTGIMTVLYLIGFIVQLSGWSSIITNYGKGANIAAGVFGLINTFVYAAGTYFLYVEHRSGATQ